MSTKQLTRIAIFSALAFVLRMAFSNLPNVQPIMAFFLLISIFYGLYESLLVMMICMLISSFLLGFGPWVFWQISSFSIVFFIWLYVFYPLSKKIRVYRLGVQAGLAALSAICYGIIIDSCFAYLYSMPWWTYVLSGLSFTLIHALSTFIFYPILFSIFRRLSHEKI
ncbi:ECF transporter S component [Streptococcus catagoni]|uniref:ECF transporter S component n=1 Tax=Streptococcus catagoni TaxID=2654874 RepID=UPI0014081DE0|nr:ECF transporter S component [Streptococcus catagoni]